MRQTISMAMPLMWVSGNGIANRSPGSIASETQTPRAPAAIEASPWTAPFAAEVVPEVWRIQRTGSGSAERVHVGSVAGSFIPPQERLYAGGPTSVRGFNQNELGDVVYIARAGDVNKGDTTVAPVRYQVPDTAAFERVVPLGGNRLLVANLEYRVRDAFILPKLLQYTFFIDAGNVWNMGLRPVIKFTPGIGLRLSTPIGPVQLNAGYNKYPRPEGSMYFEDPARVATPVSPLYCVSPGNTIDLVRTNGVLQAPSGAVCPRTYRPVQPLHWYQRLAWTFSIGPDF